MDLMENGQWVACAEQAALALAQGEWSRDQKACLLLARSTSLRRQNMNTEAFEPGRLAVYLAEDVGDADLLGRSLANLAWIQHKIPGLEPSAVLTQRRWFDLFPRYKTIRGQYLVAMLNLGVYLRAAGRYSEALEQFEKTYRAANERKELRYAQLSLRYATWEALRLNNVSKAEGLIREGANYLKDTTDSRLEAGQLLDLAQLAMLKQDPASAAGYVIAAMPLIEKAQENEVQTDEASLLPVALEILSQVGERFKDPEYALVAAILAKCKAEDDDRQDLVADAVEIIRDLALRYPDVVAKVMATLDGARL